MVGQLRQKGTAVLQAADKANGPALTLAAAAVGVAGGLALRQRPRLTHDSMAKRSRMMLQDVDPSAIMESLGKTTLQLSRRSKTIARDLDRIADQVERLGKILS